MDARRVRGPKGTWGLLAPARLPTLAKLAALASGDSVTLRSSSDVVKRRACKCPLHPLRPWMLSTLKALESAEGIVTR